jgi:flagellar basal body rod protein FlgG
MKGLKMFNLNIFSGNTYTGTDTFKVRQDGEVFTKCGDTWIGQNGQIIRDDGDKQINLTTGIMSTFGDPFGDDDAS